MTHPPPSSTAQDVLKAADARRLILDSLSPVTGGERVELHAALGRVLAQDVIAPLDVPMHDNSAMDGYAVRAEDLDSGAGSETRLKVVGSALAGHPFAGRLRPGEAVRIMTGAVIPDGADTVVMQEIVRREDDRIFIPAGQQKGRNLRRAGEDLAAGSVALPAGRRCGPAELGLIASLGIGEVAVRRRLRVAFFSTGDELTPIGQPLKPGAIHDSNRHTLAGALARLGCELLDLGIVPDRPTALEAAFAEAAGTADVVITSGGVSVGDADFIRELMARMGEVSFWKLAIKPGRPMAFGRIGDAVLFGLPGNPVATMVSFYQFVQDALLSLMGVTPLPPAARFAARADFALRKPAGRVEYLRGRLLRDGAALGVTLAGAQGSGMLHSMSEADCFIVLPEDCTSVQAGDTVFIQPFHGLV
ncbi:gephyrin-like molybdotransferase Glp [Thauera butanivorans]|uniref:molybdopterin molybdotransferase MoeA n=1 Tax=Thauera butanivorans TaxID=86174 RepID=UPI003AB74607